MVLKENVRPEGVMKENVRPEGGPNDNDRARFGFNFKRWSHADVTKASVSKPATSFVKVPSSSNIANKNVFTQVSLLDLVEKTMGDPDEHLALCRKRLVCDKFDFRNRIAELQEQNLAVKTALRSKMDQHKELIRALTSVEAEINCQFRLSARDASAAREQLQDRGSLRRELQQAVRPALLETVRSAFSEMPTPMREIPETPPRTESAEAMALDVLKRCCQAEARRADIAEASLEETRQELAYVMDDHLDAVAQARQQIDESQALLRQQIENDALARQELLRIAQEREAELLAELESVKARVGALETEVSFDT